MIILFLLPVTVLYLFFFIYPSIRAFYVSLFDWSGFSNDMDFIGLGNFIELFHDSHFWSVVMNNTFIIIFIGGIIIFTIAFILCGVLTTDIKGKKFYRAILFFPSVVNPVAVAILWSFIYNKQWGLLNNLLRVIGLENLEKAWLAPDTLIWSILVALVWMYTGFYCVILLAAFDRVPQGLIEAAQLEGANELKIFFKIKIPMIWDVLTTAIILWCINAVKEFSLLYAWGGGVDVPPPGSQNLATYMYMTAFGRRVTIYRMGYSTAMGVVMFLLIVTFVIIVSLLAKRETIEY
ncbi:carbohydrate ABC transporter permease [Vallitalea okinawensis]|uniref:carbohydrate ABC transporter permease n=1 Tax=Vallitalea okinawensis TaxID=2078660 RepID=UPI000CFB338A|nr:sugar ABC transporter permease [Vallitalea okinawensis]